MTIENNKNQLSDGGHCLSKVDSIFCIFSQCWGMLREMNWSKAEIGVAKSPVCDRQAILIIYITSGSLCSISLFVSYLLSQSLLSN